MKPAILLGLLSLVVAIETAYAFDASTRPWRSGETEFKTEFFNSPSPDPKFKQAFEEAMRIWTENSTFVFTADSDSSADPCGADVLNGISFEEDDCGDAYGASTLAVQTATFSGGQRTRSVITFNSAVNWDVFSGNQAGSTDFQRVAIHELGHSLGLGHEDSGVPAIMRSFIGSIEVPTTDDINGVAFMYDTDDDGVGIAEDNCSDVANTGQDDQDEDGVGDACDADIDGDEVFNGETVDQAYAVSSLVNSFFFLGAENGGNWWAQTFTAAVAGQLTGVKLPTSCDDRENGQPSNLSVSIQGATASGLPNGVEIDAITVDDATGVGELGLMTFDLSGGGTASLIPGDQYAIVVSSNGECFYQVGSGDYSPGRASVSGNGSTWFGQSFDLPFLTIVSPTTLDNCPMIINADQADADNDEIGDACEDMDSDAVDDDVDNCPNTPNTDQANLDQDSFGDLCDSDMDGDGVDVGEDSDDRNPLLCIDSDDDQCDDCSSGMFDPADDGEDTNGNGICDLSDPDNDGDGVSDAEPDNCPDIANPDQADADGNGVGDLCEAELCVPVKAGNGNLALICI